jgi:tRNA pseudouridine55 synthase
MDKKEDCASPVEFWQSGQILILNKPLGWTSFDLVKKIRYSLKHKYRIRKIKVGHAGTLDPLASGLMIICTGKATKKLEEFQGLNKEYIADIRLGSTTPSFDQESDIDNIYPVDHINEDIISVTLKGFMGQQEQEPPIFSAKKLKGKRAYDHARDGETVFLEPNSVVFYELELMRWVMPDMKIRIKCSKGTYIRSFARDLGKKLGSGGHLIGLKRTSIGDISLDQAMEIEDFNKILNQT